MRPDGGPLGPIDEATGLEAIDREECLLLLSREYVGRLALVDHDRPSIFPVNYRLDGQRIVIRTAAGTKLAAAGTGRWGAFEVDFSDRMAHQGWSVVASGPVAEITNHDEISHLETLQLRPWAGGRDRWIVLIIEELSGRRLKAGHHEPR